MRFLICVIAVALTSSSVMALDTAMALKGRFDYISTKTDENPGKTSSGVLTTSYLRLSTDAKFNETTTAKITLDFQDSNTKDNGLNDLVDEAYITKTFGNLSFMVGKQFPMIGGRENDYATKDIYVKSTFSANNVPYNLTGITAGYTFADQNIYVQYLQQKTSDQTPFTDKKYVGITYYGNFMNKMIMPILSYHKAGTARAGAYDTLGTAGIRFNVASFIIEADYLMVEQESLGAVNNDAKLTSVVTHVRYVTENFQPFAKYITEDGKKGYASIVSGAVDSERTAWEVGLEYIPNKDEDMRYHVVYNSSESKKTAAAPTSKKEEQKLYAGLAFNFNILK